MSVIFENRFRTSQPSEPLQDTEKQNTCSHVNSQNDIHESPASMGDVVWSSTVNQRQQLVQEPPVDDSDRSFDR